MVLLYFKQNLNLIQIIIISLDCQECVIIKVIKEAFQNENKFLFLLNKSKKKDRKKFNF